MSNKTEPLRFLASLENDKTYMEKVRAPMHVKRAAMEEILKSRDSKESDIRYAQGALEILDWHNEIFEHNRRQLDALERKAKGATNGSRKPNITAGRYCT